MTNERYHTNDDVQKRQWLQRLNKVPRSVLPNGPARDQLVREIHIGDLVDAYAAPHATHDFQGWIIERPTPGRIDSRWPAVEWIHFVSTGMLLSACGICNNVPALYMTDADRDYQGRRVPLCHDCNCKLTGTGQYGKSKHYFVMCAECGRPGLAYEATETICTRCTLMHHFLKRSKGKE